MLRSPPVNPATITIRSVFDSQGRRIAEYNQATGALIREYVWLNWEPIAVIEGGVTYLVRTDRIGRPVFATNTSGVKVWTATPARAGVRVRSAGKQSTGLFSDPPHPFGGVRTTTGTPINARFPGQWFQSESGLHQNWMRDYDPTTGRYLQADPLGLVDGASVYGYAVQSPMMYVDPRGEEKQPYVLPIDPSGLGPYWVPIPHSRAGNLYRCSCSDETLRFDPWNAGGNPSPHWHYYPDGSNLGKYGQYMTPETGPHLPPGTIIMIENCDPGSGGLPVPVPTEQTTRFMQFLFILGIIGGTIVFG